MRYSSLVEVAATEVRSGSGIVLLGYMDVALATRVQNLVDDTVVLPWRRHGIHRSADRMD